MNEEMVVMNEEEVEVYDEEPKASGGKFAKLAIIGAIVGAGAIGVLHKTKNKRKERQIKKLEDEGYVVQKPQDDDGEMTVEMMDE